MLRRFAASSCLAAVPACWLGFLATACASSQTGPRASAQALELDPDSCRPLPRERQSWLGAEWKPYLPFVKSCEVRRGKTAALFVISVWANDYYASLPSSASAVDLPKPILASADGKTLGRLPEVFPRDPPRTLDVTFANWESDFPREIRLRLEDPSVTGDRNLPPLIWDPNTHTYNTRKKKGN
jgi:hypothetical protein